MVLLKRSPNWQLTRSGVRWPWEAPILKDPWPFDHVTNVRSWDKLKHLYFKFHRIYFMTPSYGWGSSAPRIEQIWGSRNSWYSFHQPQKIKRLSQSWTHPVVLTTRPLDWESSSLTIWQDNNFEEKAQNINI